MQARTHTCMQESTHSVGRNEREGERGKEGRGTILSLHMLSTYSITKLHSQPYTEQQEKVPAWVSFSPLAVCEVLPVTTLYDPHKRFITPTRLKRGRQLVLNYIAHHEDSVWDWAHTQSRLSGLGQQPSVSADDRGQQANFVDCKSFPRLWPWEARSD